MEKSSPENDENVSLSFLYYGVPMLYIILLNFRLAKVAKGRQTKMETSTDLEGNVKTRCSLALQGCTMQESREERCLDKCCNLPPR